MLDFTLSRDHGKRQDERPAVPGYIRAPIFAALFASIFLQRLSLPGGTIPLNLLVSLGALASLALRGELRVEPVRAALALLFIGCVCVSAAFNAASTSTLSALYVVLLYLPFAFALRRPEGVFRYGVGLFQTMVMVCALCGIAQFAVQYVIHTPFLFAFQGLVPSTLLLSHFNTTIPLRWGSSLFKANGFFFLEPSMFSQYLAIAIVMELLFFGTTRRLLIYCIALPLSFSGTGMLMLAVLLPLLLIRLRDYRSGLALLALAAIAVAFGKDWHINDILGRINEFGSSGSSATERFVAGIWLIGSDLLPSPLGVIFGLGPGSFDIYAKLVSYQPHDASPFKLLFEYGLVGSLAFWCLFVAAVFRRAPSLWLSAALTIGFLVFGGMLLDPRLNILLLIFCVLPKPAVPLRSSLRSATAHPRDDWPTPEVVGAP